MPVHKFLIGQKVVFQPELGQVANRGEVFIVIRQPRESDGAFQYQIKSEMDAHVRMVRERQLAIYSWPDAIQATGLAINAAPSSRAAASRGFVAFSEMLADLTPKPLFDKTSSWDANLNRCERAPKPTT